MNHRLLCTLTALCLAALPLLGDTDKDQDRLGFAKATEGESRGCPERWTCIIGCPNTAMTVVKLASITSISKQTYMLEGSQKVTEVTIDTEGNNSIRFYCVASARANSALERAANARDLVDKHTGSASKFPAKAYPEATHSHNIEYQVSTPAQLNRIYESVTHAWVKNISSTLRVKN